MITAIYGPTPDESLARYVQGSVLYWKMCQGSSLALMGDQGTPDEFSGTWPKSGLMRGGIVYPRHQRALHINDLDGGLSGWPTPTYMDYIERTGMRPGEEAKGKTVGYLSEAIIKWPTPNASDANGANNKDDHDVKRGYLRGVVERFPTPDSSERGTRSSDLIEENGRSVTRRESGQRKGIDLETDTKFWPTPTSAEGRKIGSRANYGQVALGNHPDIVGLPDRPKGQKSRAGDGLRTTNPGTKDRAVLNPDWVEWLMGLPQNWVTLEPIDPSAYATWFEDMSAGRWWLTERDIPRVAVGMKKRIDRLKALGNGIVPAALARFLTYDD